MQTEKCKPPSPMIMIVMTWCGANLVCPDTPRNEHALCQARGATHHPVTHTMLPHCQIPTIRLPPSFHLRMSPTLLSRDALALRLSIFTRKTWLRSFSFYFLPLTYLLRLKPHKHIARLKKMQTIARGLRCSYAILSRSKKIKKERRPLDTDILQDQI